MDRLDKWFNRTVNFLANKVSDILDKTDIIKNDSQVKKIKKSSEPFKCPVNFQAKKEFLINALSHKDFGFRAKGTKYISGKKYFLPEILDVLTISLRDREPLVRYTVAFSLGILCSEEIITGILEGSSESRMKFPGITKERINKVIEALKDLRKDEIPYVKTMAEEALRKTGHSETVDDITEKALNKFPAHLKELIEKEDDTFIEKSINLCKKETHLIEALYDIDSVITRKALNRLILEADFSKSWKYIKSIYKKAEYRMDMEIFGLLAYKIEKTHSLSPLYDKKTWKRSHRFCKKTKSYIMRRCWRYLRNIAKYYPEVYANFAYFFLKHFKDSDAGKIEEIISHRYDWNERRSYTITKNYDRFSHLWTFNHILHKKSKRYTFNNLQWICAEGYKPSDTEPAEREEAFSDLWEEDSLPSFNLFLESECREVSSFAIKILRDRFPESFKNLTGEEIFSIFKKPYPSVCHILVDILNKNFDPDCPDRNLIKLLLNCEFKPVRDMVHEWIRKTSDLWKEEKTLLYSLFNSCYEDNISFAMELISVYCKERPHLKGEFLDFLLDTIIKPEKFPGAHTEIVKGLNIYFSEEMKFLTFEKIFKLLHSPSGILQELGGVLLGEALIDPFTVDKKILTELACHEMLLIRKRGKNMIKTTIALWDISLLLPLTETIWEDTRSFAFTLMEENFSIDKFTCDIILRLYDSNYKDVQDFAKKILLKYISEGNIVEFIKFTEHPDIKEFALHMITENLSPEPDKIKELKPFFKSILFKVNKGRKAKNKLLSYIEKIAVKDAFIAAEIMILLEEFAGTMTKKDFSDCLTIMVRIKMKYPYIKSSI
jgi:hypothetical protein